MEQSTIRGTAPAAVLMGATLLTLVGSTWDIQWHADVGPDTFFTVPHLLLYAGAAIAGLVSLGVVLATTAAQRAGRPIDPAVGGRPVRVFGGVFTAPVGYIVSGTGAALFLLYGLWDLWWHSLYGFDAVIDSPPHIGLLLSDMITAVGVVLVFAAGRRGRGMTVGALTAVAILLSTCTVVVLGFSQLPGPVDWIDAGTAFLVVLLLALGSGFLGRVGVLGVAAITLGMQLLFWWFAPWAARAYADAVGLTVRDYIDGVPVTPALVPFCLLPVAALMAALHRWPVAGGGLAGVVIAGCSPLQVAWLYDATLRSFDEIFPTMIAGAVLGMLGGYLGSRYGGMLRLLAPGPAVTTGERNA